MIVTIIFPVNCPNGYDRVNDTYFCSKFELRNNLPLKFTYQEAYDYCAADGAILFQPKTEEDTLAVARYLIDAIGKSGFLVWIGLKENEGSSNARNVKKSSKFKHLTETSRVEYYPSGKELDFDRYHRSDADYMDPSYVYGTMLLAGGLSKDELGAWVFRDGEDEYPTVCFKG